jgi:hypothetical protein
VYFGEAADFLSADDSNEEGYWEHRKVVWLHRKFELSLNLSNLGVDALPREWKTFPVSQLLIDQNRKLLATSFSNRPLWGWKDPDASWFVPFILESLFGMSAQPHFVICIRRPAEVCASQARRAGTPANRTLASWLRHTLAALDDTAEFSRKIVRYEDLVQEPSATISALQNFLSISASAQQQDAASAAVQNDQYRNRTSESIPGTLGSMAERVYALCASTNDEQFRTEISKLRAEFDALCHALVSPIPPSVAVIRWTEDGTAKESRLAYFPDRHWQSLEFDLEGKVGVPASARLFGPPGNVWLRSATWSTNGVTKNIAIDPGTDSGCLDMGHLRCFQVGAGSDQVQFTFPTATGRLRLEILVEFSSYLVATHSETLLRQLRSTER